MNDEHRQTAARWHGGQSSPLYAYASTGTVVAGVDREIRDCVDIVERGEPEVDADPVEEHERLMALLHHVEPQVAITTACEVGREHGENAGASWQQDAFGGRATGDTTATARRVLRGIEDGDPAILDALPGWVDGYTATDLQADCSWPEPDLDDREAHRRWDAVLTDLWSAYQTALHDAVRESVVRSCERELTDDGRTPNAVLPIGPDDGSPVYPTSAAGRSPYIRSVSTSITGVPRTSVDQTPQGWIAEPISRWDGSEVEVVYDPRRFEVAVTSSSGASTASFEAGGWELQATDGRQGLWIRDRTVAAHAALAQHDQRPVGTEAGGLGPAAELRDATRGLEL